MAINQHWNWTKLRDQICTGLIGPHALAFFPTGVLAAYWIGGEAALIGTAAAMSIVFLAIGGFSATRNDKYLPRDVFDNLIETVLEKTIDRSRGSALFHIKVDDYASLIERHGQIAADTVIEHTGDRILMVLRDDDIVTRLGDCRFVICLGPSRHMDLEVCIQMAGHIQTMIEEPISIDGVSVYVTATIGFCLSSRAPGANSKDWAQASSIALREAQKRGPASIRAFTDEMRRVAQV